MRRNGRDAPKADHPDVRFQPELIVLDREMVG
jgi:hypothetical protein